ncbi:unnamed protein product [Tuber aestivum]|uniref:VWFA domain-containing protein n=1 Tax=Tuber aestivum TaxID=59557 RepID=A0A292PL89_9PEZI|nr:unnamed protein product [Tuber aestivum]
MTARVSYFECGSQRSLPLISTTLRSHLVDLTASHTLTQVYSNSHSSSTDIAEARYTFPLYESSAVTDFQALVGERTIKGVVKEKAEAKAIYEAAKSAGKVTALFSQDTCEVFTTSLGNIPARSLVVVVIKYVHELKQDIDVDGLKLVVPTVIAPKYGEHPIAKDLGFGNRWRACWGLFSREIRDIGDAENVGLCLSVTATMSGAIRGISSPSHPISIGLGSHSSTDDADYDPKKAHATLALALPSLMGLDKDFTLLINANNIGDPRAFFAPHPAIAGTSTLMITMVPKFVLPPQGHEIVFVVDRSGSMLDKIATVRSALHLFLASLPAGSYFNICSFGSNHSSLWPRSRKYSEESLSVAKAHVMRLDSDMGGTEILAPVTDTMSRRRPDMRTEILILTDGEVWNTESMFQFIKKSSEDGNVRFFSLGVGDTVSHGLVEGISRAGRGYSQIVSTTSNLQKKVMRMLKAALTPHVNDWGVDWAGKPEAQRATLATPAPGTVAPISLFDPNCDPDSTPSAPSSGTPTLTLPKVVQAPTMVPALFPYSRATVYFLISNGHRPEKVFLKGSAHDTNSNTICPLQIEIPVHAITSVGASLGLYQLAGRKLLQDLEEGRLSYLEGIYDETKEPTKRAELIAKEGTRVGLEFGLASKWTSFVAVAEDESTREVHASEDVLAKGEQTASFESASPSSMGPGFWAFAQSASVSPKSGAMQFMSPHGQQQAQALSIGGGAEGRTTLSGGLFGGRVMGAGTGGALFGAAPRPSTRPTVCYEKMNLFNPSAQDTERVQLAMKAPIPLPSSSDSDGSPYLAFGSSPGYSPSSPPPPAQQFQQVGSQLNPKGPHELVSQIATLQQFSGMFKSADRIFAWLGLQNCGLEMAHADVDFVATVAVILALESRFPQLVEEWELMVSKAKEAVGRLYSQGDREVVASVVRVALGL